MIPDGIKNIIDFESGKGGIFFIHCEEPFLKKNFKKEISLIENLTEKPFFYDLAENKNALTDALAMSKEFGFFGMSRVVVVDGCEESDAAAIDRVVENIGKTVDKNYLILFFTEMDKRRKSTSAIVSGDKFFYIPQADTRYKERFIKSKLGDIVIPDEFISYILSSGNISLMELNLEIEKLLIFADMKNKKELSLIECQSLTSISEESKIYDIPMLLSYGKKSEAIIRYRDFIKCDSEQKVIPVMISLFFNHFKTIMEVLSENQSDSEIRHSAAKNRAFYLKPVLLRSIIIKIKKKDIITALRKLSEIELTFKGAEGTVTSDINIDIEQFMLKFF